MELQLLIKQTINNFCSPPKEMAFIVACFVVGNQTCKCQTSLVAAQKLQDCCSYICFLKFRSLHFSSL